MPSITTKDISSIRKEIEVVAAAAEIESALEKVYAEIGKKAKLKGFRPGKIPRSVLEQNYRQQAESEALQEIIRRTYPDALDQAGIHPVAPPQIDVTGFDLPRSLTYRATVEIFPVIDVKNHTGLALTREKMEVKDEEVEENLKSLQDRMTQLVPLIEIRKSLSGDVLAIDYRGFHGGQAIEGFKGDGFLVELGKGHLFPELESALTGMDPGQKKRVKVTLPANGPDKTWAGREVEYEVCLKEIKQKKVPELNDDFARDLGKFQTLQEVRDQVRADIARGKEQSQKNALRRAVIQKLVDANAFDLPEALVEWEIEDMFRRLEGNLKAQGMTLEQAGMTKEDFARKNREEAVFQARGAVLFGAVAQKEKLDVTPEEVDQRIEAMANLSGQAPAVWKKYYRENNLLGRIAASVLEEKALDFVLTQSTIKTKE